MMPDQRMLLQARLDRLMLTYARRLANKPSRGIRAWRGECDELHGRCAELQYVLRWLD